MYLSIILPYYKKFIKKTLNSIINQSFKKKELIIIYDQTNLDDLDYIKNTRKIKYKIIINKKNLGVGELKHRNKKIKSKYIAFCDADDVWHKKN